MRNAVFLLLCMCLWLDCHFMSCRWFEYVFQRVIARGRGENWISTAFAVLPKKTVAEENGANFQWRNSTRHENNGKNTCPLKPLMAEMAIWPSKCTYWESITYYYRVDSNHLLFYSGYITLIIYYLTSTFLPPPGANFLFGKMIISVLWVYISSHGGCYFIGVPHNR